MTDQEEIVDRLNHMLTSVSSAALMIQEKGITVSQAYLLELGEDLYNLLGRACMVFGLPFPDPRPESMAVAMCDEHGSMHMLDPDNPVDYAPNTLSEEDIKRLLEEN